MKILLIDNEKEVRELLKDMIEAVAPGIHQLDEADGVATGLQKINAFKPDIVFLDVEMGDGTGFDLMNKIPHPSFQLIFTTAHNKYAVQAFKCSAIDYLLKPIDITELENSLQKANTNIDGSNLGKQLTVLMQQLSNKEAGDKQIVLKDSEASYFVKVADILYCEAEGSYTKFYLSSEKPIIISKNLSTYEELLGVYGFIRTHHSYLVNSARIKMYDKTDGGTLILDTGHTVPISHRKKDYVMHLLENR
ncbi:MAG: LytTR family DNA-binding domain-containing protein [Chitinophagaceae bacterium]|nr:LytTR family DNA-binding domain-containing protein [Chitinophagaceae bacterium]